MRLVCIVAGMSAIEDQLSRLHNDLAILYRGGSVDSHRIRALWLSIERLELEVLLSGGEV